MLNFVIFFYMSTAISKNINGFKDNCSHWYMGFTYLSILTNPINMENFKEQALSLAQEVTHRMPFNDGTVASYKSRFEVFTENVTVLNRALVDFSNNFIKENKSSEADIEEIKSICVDVINDLTAKFNANERE